MKSAEIEIGNFTLLFGEEFVLKDLYDEIVLPAFKRSDRIHLAGNEYFLHKVKPVALLRKNGSPASAIIGRMVKNTNFKSQQIFDDGELKPDNKSIRTSPSCFFVLYLEKHRLIFVREMSHAPFLLTFESVVSKLLKRAHRSYLKEIADDADNEFYKKASVEGERPTLKSLEELIPKPSLDIRNIASGESLSDFIMEYESLRKLTVDVLEVNEEVDAQAVYKGLRNQKKKFKANKTAVIYQSGDGLDKSKVVEALSGIAAAGNHKITTLGTDQQGNKKEGNSNDYKLKHPIKKLPANSDAAANLVHAEIIQMIDAGLAPIEI